MKISSAPLIASLSAAITRVLPVIVSYCGSKSFSRSTPELALGQVADVADGADDGEVLAEVTADGLRLGRRLND